MNTLTVASVLALIAASVTAYEYPNIPADKTAPTQTRLSFKDLNAVSVAWNTYEPIPKPCVAYGTSPDNLKKARMLVQLGHLPDLAPATTYYYKIDSTNSTTKSFKSAHKPGDTSSFVVNAVIDMGRLWA